MVKYANIINKANNYLLLQIMDQKIDQALARKKCGGVKPVTGIPLLILESPIEMQR
jgi:hypothetical protein